MLRARMEVEQARARRLALESSSGHSMTLPMPSLPPVPPSPSRAIDSVTSTPSSSSSSLDLDLRTGLPGSGDELLRSPCTTALHFLLFLHSHLFFFFPKAGRRLSRRSTRKRLLNFKPDAEEMARLHDAVNSEIGPPIGSSSDAMITFSWICFTRIDYHLLASLSTSSPPPSTSRKGSDSASPSRKGSDSPSSSRKGSDSTSPSASSSRKGSDSTKGPLRSKKVSFSFDNFFNYCIDALSLFLRRALRT